MIFTLGFASTLAACTDDDTSTDETAGAAAVSTSGHSGGGGKAGSSAGRSGSGGGGKAGTTAAVSGSGGQSSSAPAAGNFTCTEEAPKEPVTCGGQTCSAPTDFAMNPCIIPCCVQQGGKQTCGSRSTADMLTTACVLPAKPAAECPDVDSQNGPLKGCCNTQQRKCGIISTLRPGCITESQLVMIGNQACGGGAEDAGVEPDAG